MNIRKFAAPAIALTLLFPVLTFGATFKAGEEVSFNEGVAINDNLYAAGGSVSVNNAVLGDVFAAGGNILISENVSKDITVAGGSITVLGNAGDDVRIAGGNILVAGNVGGELIVTGGSVNISSDTVVTKDVTIAGGQVSLNGTVNGNAKIVGGVATVNGTVRGNLDVEVDSKVTLGESAVVYGDVIYSSKDEEALTVAEGATVYGEVVHEELEVGPAESYENVGSSIFGAFVAIKVLLLLVTALIFVWLFKKFSNSVATKAIQNPLRMIGKGFVTVIVVPVAAILLFVTVLGFPIGLITFLSYIILMVLSGVYAGVAFGAWLTKVSRKAEFVEVTWKNAIIGVLVLAIVSLIPFIGWIIAALVFLATVGSITDIAQKKFWSERNM